MPDPHPPQRPNVSDDELLARATPIEPDEAAQGEEDDELMPIDFDESPLEEADPDASGQGKIRAFGSEYAASDPQWKRQPNVTGHGATHVRTFFAKLRPDAIHHIDDQINQWLDDHPDYEVKFVNTTHGILKGKSDEEALIVSVWV